MNIYALSDPHLSGARPKTMDIFGGHWQDHDKRICYNWQMQVDPEDYVLLPGDKMCIRDRCGINTCNTNLFTIFFS